MYSKALQGKRAFLFLTLSTITQEHADDNGKEYSLLLESRIPPFLESHKGQLGGQQRAAHLAR